MTWPTWDQIQGVVERLVALGLVYAIARGWVGKDDAQTYGPAVVGLIAAIYAAWHNRPMALVQRAAALPDTTVVTMPALAKSTPEPNIVSSATNTVSPTTAADLNLEELARHGA